MLLNKHLTPVIKLFIENVNFVSISSGILMVKSMMINFSFVIYTCEPQFSLNLPNEF